VSLAAVGVVAASTHPVCGHPEFQRACQRELVSRCCGIDSANRYIPVVTDFADRTYAYGGAVQDNGDGRPSGVVGATKDTGSRRTGQR